MIDDDGVLALEMRRQYNVQLFSVVKKDEGALHNKYVA
jgi:hypothetical protein